MKKVLFFLLSLFCFVTISRAEIAYVPKWKNDSLSIASINHMLQTKDGLIIAGYDQEYNVLLVKLDKDGKEIKKLKFEYEGMVNGLFEANGKYYAVTSNDDSDWEIIVYEITTDLTIVRKKETGYHMGGAKEQIDIINDKMLITTTSLGSVDGIYDENDDYYNYIEVKLSDFSVKKGINDFNVFSKGMQKLLALNYDGLPVLDVKDNGEVTVLSGRYSDTSDSEGFVYFFSSKSEKNIVEMFMNNEQLNKKEIEAGTWYSTVEMLDLYIAVAGESYGKIDLFDFKGKYLESIDLASYLYNKNSSELSIEVTDLVYQGGKFSLSYSVCSANECKAGVALLQKPYTIETVNDGHGTVTVSKESEYGDEEVTVTITPEEGYELGEIKVVDKEGNVILFKDNSFIMPYSDVVVDVTFVPINPETLAGVAIIGLIVLLVISLSIAIINVKKARELL